MSKKQMHGCLRFAVGFAVFLFVYAVAFHIIYSMDLPSPRTHTLALLGGYILGKTVVLVEELTGELLK